MLFNGKFAFCQFSMLFNGNLRFEKLRGMGGDGRTDGRTYGRTYGICPLCPTGHRPFGAAAQKEEEEEEGEERELVAKRHHMVSGTLALLYTVFQLKLGCRGAASPIGDEVL